MSINIIMFIIFYVPVTLIYTALYVSIIKESIKNVDRDITDKILVVFLGYVLTILWIFIIFECIAIIVSVLQGG